MTWVTVIAVEDYLVVAVHSTAHHILFGRHLLVAIIAVGARHDVVSVWNIMVTATVIVPVVEAFERVFLVH